jgi:hypothetical protein
MFYRIVFALVFSSFLSLGFLSNSGHDLQYNNNVAFVIEKLQSPNNSTTIAKEIVQHFLDNETGWLERLFNALSLERIMLIVCLTFYAFLLFINKNVDMSAGLFMGSVLLWLAASNK